MCGGDGGGGGGGHFEHSVNVCLFMHALVWLLDWDCGHGCFCVSQCA